MEKNEHRLLAIFASLPTPTLGVIDPILHIATLCRQSQVGLHVDLSYGVFVMKNPILEISGITSVSALFDHFGMTPRGAVAFIGQPLFDRAHIVDVAENQIERPSAVIPFQAMLAMLSIGRHHYEKIGLKLQHHAREVGRIIRSNDSLELIREPALPIVAFRLKNSSQSDAFYEEMKKRGIPLTPLGKGALHFCITSEFITVPNVLEIFERLIRESLEVLDKKKSSQPSD